MPPSPERETLSGSSFFCFFAWLDAVRAGRQFLNSHKVFFFLFLFLVVVVVVLVLVSLFSSSSSDCRCSILHASLQHLVYRRPTQAAMPMMMMISGTEGSSSSSSSSTYLIIVIMVPREKGKNKEDDLSFSLLLFFLGDIIKRLRR
jgi:hypothetical protein